MSIGGSPVGDGRTERLIHGSPAEVTVTYQELDVERADRLIDEVVDIAHRNPAVAQTIANSLMGAAIQLNQVEVKE